MKCLAKFLPNDCYKMRAIVHFFSVCIINWQMCGMLDAFVKQKANDFKMKFIHKMELIRTESWELRGKNTQIDDKDNWTTINIESKTQAQAHFLIHFAEWIRMGVLHTIFAWKSIWKHTKPKYTPLHFRPKCIPFHFHLCILHINSKSNCKRHKNRLSFGLLNGICHSDKYICQPWKWLSFLWFAFVCQ